MKKKKNKTKNYSLFYFMSLFIRVCFLNESINQHSTDTPRNFRLVGVVHNFQRLFFNILIFYSEYDSYSVERCNGQVVGLF